MEPFKKILHTPSVFVLLLAAIVSLIGIIIKSKSDVTITRIPVDATATVEIKLTQMAIVANPTQTAFITGNNKNSIVGRIRWNEKPLEGISIVLFQGICGENPYLSTTTDSLGNYKFTDLVPNKYAVGVNGWAADEKNSFPGKNGIYTTACSELLFTPESEKVAGEFFDLVKVNLVILTPSETFVTEKPIFSWEKYPDASYYEVRIYKNEGNVRTTIVIDRITNTEHELSQSLEQGYIYTATITAYNSNGFALAEQSTTGFQVTPK